jgi:hypothetical protein
VRAYRRNVVEPPRPPRPAPLDEPQVEVDDEIDNAQAFEELLARLRKFHPQHDCPDDLVNRKPLRFPQRPRDLPVTDLPLVAYSSPVEIQSQEKKHMPAKKTRMPVPANGPGIIKTIVGVISRAKGASVNEIVDVLTEKFPGRDVDGMRATTRTQVQKKCTSRERDARRGVVYFCKKR